MNKSEPKLYGGNDLYADIQAIVEKLAANPYLKKTCESAVDCGMGRGEDEVELTDIIENFEYAARRLQYKRSGT